MSHSTELLTNKEKETLRLIVRGHDAKSAANELDLSVHTINERLRAARRKLDVTSSRAAARVLLESEGQYEGAFPENLGYKRLGDAAAAHSEDDPSIATRGRSLALWIGGIAMISFAAALVFALVGYSDAEFGAGAREADAAEATSVATDAQREAAARNWLELVDRGDWQASFDAAGRIFRDPNTVQSWTDASQLARVPLGDAINREAISFQLVASPEAYEVVQFRTDFANRKGAIESVTLQREGGVLRVVGYYIN